MLKIQISNWGENENLYHLRLNDFIDKVTLRGIELFEKNENAQEYFGTQITTRNLYDVVIGLSTDIFADKNEGKVLLMDNPFAQTNASHLLKPLMDMAKKTNTQLICFTGLGGESIYNRFDNIYILNLIAARLKNATQSIYKSRTC